MGKQSTLTCREQKLRRMGMVMEQLQGESQLRGGHYWRGCHTNSSREQKVETAKNESTKESGSEEDPKSRKGSWRQVWWI